MEKLRRFGWVAWWMLWPLLAWMVWTPISFGALRLGTLVVAFALWAGALALTRWRGLRVLIGATALPVITVLLWPSRAADPVQLREVYTARLLSYQDTPYVWGGENGRGIDCSGLMRRALIDANLGEGARTLNPSLWREAAALWWRDCSAREMKSGYDGKIRRCFAAPDLNTLAFERLQPGDMAVTQSGVHVLAHLKGKQWIQADPNLANGGDKVIQTVAPSKNGWFHIPVVIVRWRQLEAGE